DRILDGDHAESRGPIGQRRKGVLEGGAGERLPIGINVVAGDVRIGAGLALIGDDGVAHVLVPNISLARARSCGVSTPSGTASTTARSIRMPASGARNCSSFSRFSSGEGGSATKRASAARR